METVCQKELGPGLAIGAEHGCEDVDEDCQRISADCCLDRTVRLPCPLEILTA
jgi:hypothetical protein